MFFKEIRLIMVALTAVFVLSIQSSQAQSMSEADREALYIFDSIVGQMLDYAREREARKRYERRHYYAPPPPPRHYRNRPPAPHYGQQPAPRDYYAPRPNAYYFAPTPADRYRCTPIVVGNGVRPNGSMYNIKAIPRDCRQRRYR